ncbi:MAG: transposase [Bacteroidota bacterium]
MASTQCPQRQLTRWYPELERNLPHLSRPQRRTLALWTYAATLTEHIGSSTCAAFLATVFDTSENAFRQRLRECYRPAALKRGPRRRELEIQLVFGPLLRWALKLLRPPEVVLTLDPTLCRDRLAVLCVAVVAHGCAIPVAWTALRANEPGAWMPHWKPMLDRLHAVVPARTTVLVLADRGLQSPDLFAEIRALGWHPMMRLTRLGSWRERGAGGWTPLARMPLHPGESYVARGHLFSTKSLACTLVGVWREGFDAPWLLMTDLPPPRCERAFYGLRGWIEQGFRCAKAGGLRVERLRIEDPVRAERVWLVVAVSLLWTHAVGAAPIEGECFAEGFRRTLGVHRRGWLRLLGHVVRGGGLLLPRRVELAPYRVMTLAEIARPPT